MPQLAAIAKAGGVISRWLNNIEGKKIVGNLRAIRARITLILIFGIRRCALDCI
jgi:hypothetical protein